MATALGVEVVSEIRLADAKRAGKSSILVSGVDGNATKAVHITWTNGSDSVPGQLRRNAFVNDRFADDHSLKVGSPLIVTTLAGKTLRLHVHGIFDHPKGGSPFEDVAISKETFDRGFANHGNEYTLLNVRGGPSDENSARLERALRAFPTAKVETRDEFRESYLSGLQEDPEHLLCAARPLRARQHVRRHQHRRPLGLRADARDRHAARGRHEPSLGPAGWCATKASSLH